VSRSDEPEAPSWSSMSNNQPGAPPHPPSPVERPRRRRALLLLIMGLVVGLTGAVLFGFSLTRTLRDVLVSGDDLLVRVEEGEESTVELDEGEYVLVALGHDLTDSDGGSRFSFPSVDIHDPRNETLRARAPGYDAQGSRGGESWIVIADLSVEESGPHRIEHRSNTGVEPSPDAVGVAHKAQVSVSKIAGIIIGVLLMATAGVLIVVAGVFAILDHRGAPRR